MRMRTRAVTTAILWLAGIGTSAASQYLVDFEDLTLPGQGFTYGGPGTAADYVPESVLLASESAGFRTTITRYSPDEYWSGFAFSNRGDTTTAGFTNQYSSFAGGGAGGGGNFAIAYWQSYDPAPLIVLPPGTKPVSLQLVNTTYTALTMRDGDVHNFSEGEYGPGDFLSVTFSGHSAADGTGAVTGSATFLLADFQNGNQTIIGSWTPLSLAALGDARSISIGFESSDLGPFGINTPTYVAIDNLTVTAVPEPSVWTLLAGGAVAWISCRRRTRTT